MATKKSTKTSKAPKKGPSTKSARRRPVQRAGSPAPVELDGARGTSPGPLTGHPPTRSLADRESIARDVLSWAGRMVSGSKSEYLRRHPTHRVFFNANVFGADAAKLWFGDVDLSMDADKLLHLADALGETVYVTQEMPFRFELPSLEILVLQAGAAGLHPSVLAFHPRKP